VKAIVETPTAPVNSKPTASVAVPTSAMTSNLADKLIIIEEDTQSDEKKKPRGRPKKS